MAQGKGPWRDGDGGAGDQYLWVLQGAAQVLSFLTLTRVRPGVINRVHSFPAWKVLPKRRGF